MKLLIAFTIFICSFTITGQKFHTEFKYADSINKGVTIQNSYPKGGQKYTAPNGKEYIYVIFWTCITNKTDSDLELTIDFPIDSFTIPSSLGTKFQLYLPKKEMTLEKDSLFNYGLDLKSFLNEYIDKPSELVKTISPNESYLFYVVALSNKGVNNVVRAGFELQKQDLSYKINDRKINCGRIYKSQPQIKSTKQNKSNYVESNSGLKYKILKKGIGKSAENGDEVQIFETTSYRDGTKLYSNENSNNPIKVKLGANMVTKGVEEGLNGMRSGEIRELIVPPYLAKRKFYPKNVSPDSTLVIRLIVDKVIKAN